MLVQLGYYSTASAANSFTGTWTPIAGFTSASLPTQPARTSIGDAFNNNGGGGSGSGAGVIDFSTFFVSGDNQPFVYDPNFSGAYQTLSSISITNSAPPNGIILSIRFYDTTNASGNFNAVSSDAWTWQSPDPWRRPSNDQHCHPFYRWTGRGTGGSGVDQVYSQPFQDNDLSNPRAFDGCSYRRRSGWLPRLAPTDEKLKAHNPI